MNILLIISDTMRRDHLGCYGNDWIHTPNLHKLASQSFIFDKAYAGNFPTLPNRYDVMTGRFGFIEYDWSPLPHRATVISQVMGAAGYLTHFCVDTPHICQAGGFFDRGFASWQWIRGQENDRYRATPAQVAMPCDPRKLRSGRETMTQYLRNVAERRTEEDYFPAQTFSAAARWIEENRSANWFVYADTFDPHEPFDPPRHYLDLYDPGYEGEQVMYPRYARADYLTKRELKHMRALYAGEVTLVDTWVGYLLRRVEELGLLDETMIIFTTDHGFLLGEHGWCGKMAMPFYNEVARTPLFLWDPRSRAKGARRKALVQTIDLSATLLEFFGAPIPPDMQGKPLREAIAEDKPVREAALFGQFRKHVNCVDGRYVYMRGPANPENSPIAEYTMMPTHMRQRFAPQELAGIDLAGPFAFTKGCKVMRIPLAPAKADGLENLLFDLETDPAQEKPIQDPAIEARMIDHMRRLLKETDATPEQFERLGL